MNSAYLILACCLSCVVNCQEDVPEDLQEDLSKLSKANAYYAVKQFQQLSGNHTNVIFSPLSISVAFSMLNVGAAGTSSKELNSTFGFTFAQLNEQELQRGYQQLVRSLDEPSDGIQFDLANAQFLQEGFPIYPNYTSTIVEDFHAKSQFVDFAQEQETLEEINGWVNSSTRGKIDSILEHVSPLDVMALLNAVYFKGEWLYQFDENETREMDFFTEDGTRKLVKMMTNDIPAKYSPRHPIGGSVLELPYKGETFSAVFVLPDRSSNLSKLQESLTPESILGLTEDLEPQNISVGIPKFKLESELDLIEQLTALGVEQIFNDNADLSRISPAHLKVTQAKHKALIEVNEEGSVASAVTVIVTTTRTGQVRPHFYANRPFMFLLRHNPTNTVCFMGKVADV